MYIPNAFCVEDRVALHSLMQHFSFATLVTQEQAGSRSAPFASHLPFIVDTDQGEFGTLRAHMARANPQWRMFEEQTDALVVFQGPHAYISPSWYDKHPSVPTWNYAVVHAYGVPRLLNETELRQALRELVTTYEAGFTNPWSMDGLSEEYVAAMLRGIVGFEIGITRLEGKFKLSQNQSQTGVSRVISELRQSGNPLDVATAEWMAITHS